MKRRLPLPIGNGAVTLDEARRVVEAGAVDGIECPCCGRLAKVYRRKLHREMAIFLCLLVRRAGPERAWVHVRDVLKGTRTAQKASTDGAYLVHWSLIEAKPGEHSAGMYRPTAMGASFVEGGLKVSSHVHLFNNEPVGFSETLVSIRDALGSKFDYDELMRGWADES